MVTLIKIIKHDELGTSQKSFGTDKPFYDSFKEGEIIEIEFNNVLRDYYVTKINKKFTHFSEELEINIYPVRPFDL